MIVYFLHLSTAVNHHQTTIWENMFYFFQASNIYFFRDFHLNWFEIFRDDLSWTFFFLEKNPNMAAPQTKKTVEMGQLQIHFWDFNPKTWVKRFAMNGFWGAPKWRWIEDDFLFKKWCFLGFRPFIVHFQGCITKKVGPWMIRTNQQEALMKKYPNSCGEDVQQYSQQELTQKVCLYQLYKWRCNPYAL